MFNPSSELVSAGLQVMVYGLVGVFIVLILFYLVTKVMVFGFTKIDLKQKSRLENKE